MEFTDLVPGTTLTVADALVLAANAVQADDFQTFRTNEVQRDKAQAALVQQVLDTLLTSQEVQDAVKAVFADAFGATAFGGGPFGG